MECGYEWRLCARARRLVPLAVWVFLALPLLAGAQDGETPAPAEDAGHYLTVHDLAPGPVMEPVEGAAAPEPVGSTGAEIDSASGNAAGYSVHTLDDGRTIYLFSDGTFAYADDAAAGAPVVAGQGNAVVLPDAGTVRTSPYAEGLIVTPPSSGRYDGVGRNEVGAKYSWFYGANAYQPRHDNYRYEQSYTPRWDWSGFWDQGRDYQYRRQRERDRRRQHHTRPGRQRFGRP